ncbi:SPOR domain-containing protein [Fibrobacter sp. UBA4309]|uniref:SPOR domain-containing protein n=1 Tax=Fibrobacter sp. UBA4309 TaxID=1946537 RepID=UPI0025BA0EB8|nr:SPOR domain-containing protein [Fibrobacter sp. UBA4309]
MKMKFWNFRGIAAILFLICSTSAFAQSIADAQKAYVAGKWKEAAAAYEAACPREPREKQPECFLWDVLALSQTGNAQSFKIAGKRLDSLIQTTSPQNTIYADLMMTKAQFQMYLGKFDGASESLIHAIETSQPNQKAVLQKVCTALQAKTKKESLVEACKRLDSASVSTQEKAQPPAAVQTAAPEKSKTAEPAKVETPAGAEPVKSAEPAKSTESWYLQLGAFGVKANADLLVSNLKKRGISCTIEERKGETKTLFVVLTGNFETKEKAIDFGAQKLAPLNVEFRAFSRK